MITEVMEIITTELAALESYDRHQLHLAAVFFVCCAGVGLFRLWRPDVRPRLLTIACVLTLVGTVVMGSLALLVGPIEGLPPRSQTFLSSIRTLVLLLVLIYCCHIAGSTQGSKNWRLGSFCRSAPTVLLTAWGLQVAVGQIYPTTFVADSPVSMAHFWMMKCFNLLWIAYFAAAGTLFGLEVVRKQAVPSLRLRGQQSALALACACGCLLIAVGMVAAFAQAAAEVGVSAEAMPAYAYAAQSYLLAAQGLLFVIGFFLYHSNRETEHTVKQLRNWIRKRHELELLFRREFGGEVGPPETILTFRASILATPSLLSSEFAARGASNLIKLLRVLHNIDKMTTIQIKHLSSLQNNLFAQPELTYSAVERSGAYVKYDLANDPLFAAIRPAMLLCQPRAKLDLTNEEDWVQIGALAAADAGYLPVTNASKLLDPGCSAVRLGLLENYRLAKDTAPMMRLSGDLSLEKIPDYRK